MPNQAIQPTAGSPRPFRPIGGPRDDPLEFMKRLRKLAAASGG